VIGLILADRGRNPGCERASRLIPISMILSIFIHPQRCHRLCRHSQSDRLGKPYFVMQAYGFRECSCETLAVRPAVNAATGGLGTYLFDRRTCNNTTVVSVAFD
jgi:hypothetical protein